MKISSLKINGIGGIKNLELSFVDNMNVICGANGIGKSTILDIIVDAFNMSLSGSRLKRNALCEVGKYSIEILINDVPRSKEQLIKNFHPDDNIYNNRNSWIDDSDKILYFGIDRNLNYKKLDSIFADPKRENYTNAEMAVSGIKADDIKGWFINRYLFVEKEGSLKSEQISNYKLAEKAFGILDRTVKFEKVDASSLDILLSTQKGEIYFEYLSSGYKSCIYIIFGIIKEIEYRTSNNPIEAKNFKGVVLIDEIDLHLHPTWQAGLIKALKEIFPCMQFVLTTHSPSVLQILEKDEIIALGHDEQGNTCLKNLNLGEYGLQGWTLEEILRDVMEMEETTSQLYQDTLKEFDNAMNNEDEEQIIEKYNLLKKMLHPNNSLRKLLSIQVAEWED